MTTGSWSVFLNNYNQASKTWSGSDTPKQYRVDERGRRVRVYPQKFIDECAYQSITTKYRSEGFMLWTKSGSVWSPQYRQYVSWTNPCLDQPGLDNLYGQFDVAVQLSEMKAKLADRVLGTEFNAGVQLGTARETLKSVVSLSKGVLRAAIAVKSGRPETAIRYLIQGISGAMNSEPKQRALNSRRGRVRRQLELHLQESQRKRLAAERAKHLEIKSLDISQTWLSLRYGWVPMVKDIHEGLELLDEGFKDEAIRYSARSRRKVYRGRTNAGTYVERGPSWGHRDLCARVTLKRRPSTFESLGLHDPASIAWELTPFSFVVDWFVPVGDFLRSRSIAPLLDPVCWISQLQFYAAKETKFNTFKSGINPWTDLYGSNYQDGVWDERVIRFYRYADTWSKKPPVKSVSQALSLGHLENGAALIHQLIANFRK